MSILTTALVSFILTVARTAALIRHSKATAVSEAAQGPRGGCPELGSSHRTARPVPVLVGVEAL